MSRTELLQAAIDKLQQAAHLLIEAGEERLALEATELTEWVDFSIPVESSAIRSETSSQSAPR
jgi:hypothetical protein